MILLSGGIKMNQQLYDEAVRSELLSKQLISTLLESMDYNSISFINWSIEVLSVIKTRLERGDKIIDEVSKEKYTAASFKKFVKKNFSSYVFSQVYDEGNKKEKIYFSLERHGSGEYGLLMAESSHNKTYRWISSLSERFSLVEMIATSIVYLKDNKTDTYSPFISENGKYCRYDKTNGVIKEI